MHSDTGENGPAVMAVSEIEKLRGVFRGALEHYAARVDEELLAVQSLVAARAGEGALSPSQLHDLRDMLSLLRNVQIKPEKGRRKDIKKIDAIAGDLQMLVENW